MANRALSVFIVLGLFTLGFAAAMVLYDFLSARNVRRSSEALDLSIRLSAQQRQLEALEERVRILERRQIPWEKHL
jgi:hypothetical protein